jgi:hypothetical protein
LNAPEILAALTAHGARIAVDGERVKLVYSSGTPLPPFLVVAARAHKAELRTLMGRSMARRPAKLVQVDDAWSAEDWRAFFDERAGIAELDGGLTRPQAEVSAFACCVAEWLNRHPVQSASGRCHGCGGIERGDDPLLPFGIERTGHVWLHTHCWPAWSARRKAEAISALAALGIAALSEAPAEELSGAN